MLMRRVLHLVPPRRAACCTCSMCVCISTLYRNVDRCFLSLLHNLFQLSDGLRRCIFSLLSCCELQIAALRSEMYSVDLLTCQCDLHSYRISVLYFLLDRNCFVLCGSGGEDEIVVRNRVVRNVETLEFEGKMFNLFL
ncbi:unnamed protein product [Thelazia callipaeda]|uniref:Secreted protein n=1 Tax=Thelazia callipaeda TaxID=103827 RepID=A0A0N5CKK8_THECL|nr:unnamed protein product [Thelazia callipaeda]